MNDHLTDEQLDAIVTMPRAEDINVLVAEVRRLRQQRRLLLASIARKDAASGAGDRALREFLGAPDPTCGDENAGDWCELEPGHDGNHRADTVEWAVVRPVPAASEEQQ